MPASTINPDRTRETVAVPVYVNPKDPCCTWTTVALVAAAVFAGLAISGYLGGYLPLPAVYSCAGASALSFTAVAIASMVTLLKSYINEKHLAWKDLMFLCEVEQPFTFVNYGTEVPAEGPFHRELELDLNFHQAINEPFLEMKRRIEAAGQQKQLTQVIENAIDQFIYVSLSEATDYKIVFGLISSIRDETGLDSGGKGESRASIDNLNFGLSSPDSEEFASQISGFSAEVNGQRPFAKQKSTGDARKVPEDEGEKPEVQVDNLKSIIAPPGTDKPMFIRDLFKYSGTELFLAIRKERRLNQSRLG